MIDPMYTVEYMVAVTQAVKLLAGRQIDCTRVQFGTTHRVDQFILHGTVGVGNVTSVRVLVVFKMDGKTHTCRVVLRKEQNRWMEGHGRSVTRSAAIANAMNALTSDQRVV